MKAIRVYSFGDPSVLKWEETAAPTAGAGQVLVRVKAASVNPVEAYIRSGNFGPQKFPFTPGNDAAGVVEAVGDGVKEFKVGDRVYTDQTISGSYAELTLCNLSRVHPLPARVTFYQGACVGIAGGTAYRGLFQRGRGKPGETVLIHGATGGVGVSAVQLARAAKMTVVGTSATDRGRKFILEQGANHAAHHQVTQRPDEVKALTDGKGFDLILEMAADKNLESDLTAVAKSGRIVVIGSRGKTEIDPREAMGREVDILGLMLFGATAAEQRAMYNALTAALEAGTFRPVIGLELPMAEATKAHREVMEGDQFGKIVMIP